MGGLVCFFAHAGGGGAQEIKVLRRDLQLSDAVSSGLDSLGQFELYGLVKIDMRTYGAEPGPRPRREAAAAAAAAGH